MGLLDKLRELLVAEEADETGEIEEIEAGVAEAADGGEESPSDEGGEEPGDGAGDGEPEGGSGDEGEEGAEGTPSGEQESPEVAELRATIVEQAAVIEEQNNRLAAAGLEPIEADEAEADAEVEEIADEDAVTAFDEDYAKRQALLAEIKEN